MPSASVTAFDDGHQLIHGGRIVADGERAAGCIVEAHASRQDDRLIGELQPLDAVQRIGAVGDGNARADDAIVRDDGGAVGRGADGVIGERGGEHGRVEVRASRLQDLAHDHELAGIDGARQHVLHQIAHAIDAAQLGAGAIVVGAHADAHVQPACRRR